MFLCKLDIRLVNALVITFQATAVVVKQLPLEERPWLQPAEDGANQKATPELEPEPTNPVVVVTEEFEWRVFQPAPNGSWEYVDHSDRPKWYRPEGSILPPTNSKIALAFHGHYHRWSREGFEHCSGKVCSDYWVSKDNIQSSIIEPLKAAGAEVRIYFHTYSDENCKGFDQKLVGEIKPHKYEIEVMAPELQRNISHSYIEVLQLVIADDWADYTLLLRFDVQYNALITSWNLQWRSINVPFLEPADHTQNSDLLITIPRKWYASFVTNLKTFVFRGMNAVMIKQWSGFENAVHVIDELFQGSANSIPKSFLGITRDCSAAYDDCMR